MIVYILIGVYVLGCALGKSGFSFGFSFILINTIEKRTKIRQNSIGKRTKTI